MGECSNLLRKALSFFIRMRYNNVRTFETFAFNTIQL